jgi:hypothetical protein
MSRVTVIEGAPAMPVLARTMWAPPNIGLDDPAGDDDFCNSPCGAVSVPHPNWDAFQIPGNILLVALELAISGIEGVAKPFNFPRPAGPGQRGRHLARLSIGHGRLLPLCWSRRPMLIGKSGVLRATTEHQTSDI